MVEYCVYWLENGEPMHEVFSSLAAAEMYSCAIRGKENILRRVIPLGRNGVEFVRLWGIF